MGRGREKRGRDKHGAEFDKCDRGRKGELAVECFAKKELCERRREVGQRVVETVAHIIFDPQSAKERGHHIAEPK